MEDVIKIGFSLGTLIFAYLLAHRFSARREFAFLSERQGRYGALDGLRGYLALAVFIHHFIITWYWKETGNWDRPPEDYFQYFGKVGVSIFFMITGFLFISKILKDKGGTDWFKFFESRVFRIYPLYLFSLLLITIIVIFGSNFELFVEPIALIKSYIKWFFFYGVTINDFAGTRAINAGVDWSLKYEWLFYLSLPLIALAIRFGKLPTFLILFACAWLYVFQREYMEVNTTYFILFAVGGVCGYLNQIELVKSKANFFSSQLASVITAIALIIALFYPDAFYFKRIVFVSIFFFMVSLGNDLFGLFRMRPSILLGEISYSIYLLHGVVLYFSFTILNIVSFDAMSMYTYLWFMPVLCLLVVLVSIYTYLAIEAPSITYGRRYVISNKLKQLLSKGTEK